MEDLGQMFKRFVEEIEKKLKRLPMLIANEAKNFFQDRFKTQDWTDYNTQPWKRRKPGSKRNQGRAILTDTGRLKRSIRVIRADWGNVIVGTDVPYAAVHNEGFNGTVTVKEQSRIASRKIGTRELKLKGRQRRVRLGGRKVKIKGASHQVSSHTRKMNIPKRKFIGNSHVLNMKIDRLIIYELNKAA
jgi:phage gpG-like protein